ncbi:MAG TPA: M4 family metallopeptidase [Vicinamibacterales bacterium]|nr:M4 family metallopeptidase [Vicinamibacterales bacterium]
MKVIVTSAAVTAALLLSLEHGLAQRSSSPRTATPRTATPRDTSAPAGRAQRPRTPSARVAALRITATNSADLRTWDSYVTQRLGTGELRARSVDRDPAMPQRTVERLQAYHHGVPVWGSEVVRDSQAGVPVAIFGEMAADFAIETQPRLTLGEAERRLLALGGADATLLKAVELTIVRHETREPFLAYTGVVSGHGEVNRVFLDANDGSELMRYTEIQTQAATGSGRGVLGDTKKLSVLQQAGAFLADDRRRPPVLTTYDFRADLTRAIAVVDNGAPLFTSDLATDADNNWTDPAVVDAHAHIGWTYDYYFRRFGRHGLDDRDRPIVVLTNAVTQQGAPAVSGSVLSRWVINAFWCGACGPSPGGVLFFANGIPPTFFVVGSGRNYSYFAGALDIVAHELTHGVTDSSSRLIYQNESGALNEAFSDIMATSVEFFYQQPGTGPARADYLLGEDISRAVLPGSRDGDRSMENPALYGQPDHYTRLVTDPADNGGVHINSGIANHAFYLAIEGGSNRTSGLAVQGVGAANRAQIERVFYRAFVFLMPAASTFSTARAATIQAARDLYGVDSAPERAVTQAWTAVGVQ